MAGPDSPHFAGETPAPAEPVFARGLEREGLADGSMTGGEKLAFGAALVWLLGLGGFFFMRPAADVPLGLLDLVLVLVGIFMPPAMIWLAAVNARTARQTRAETQRLQQSIDALRQAWVAQQAKMSRPSVEKKLDEIAAATRQTESAIATFTSRRDTTVTVPSADRKAAFAAPRNAAPTEDQATLALGTPAEDMRAPVSVSDFVKAMNFPDNPDDRDGFRALRRALEDRTMAKLIRAAQDVLTLLAQDGIYMDDLKPDRAKPDLWRRFAKGERGREVASLGGIRDRSSLALTSGRMRQDTIFRDAAHHFLRQFDKTFTEFEANATDVEVADLAETRTARAFMLLGRVTGTFD
jgi:biopolymer transport protein ExbD